MTSIGLGLEFPDWRATASYGYTARLTRRQWAWEFLRRNLAFRKDLVVILRNAEIASSGEGIQIVRSTGDLSRWGVLFRGFVER